MRLSLKAMAGAGGILWGSTMLMVGLIHLAHAGYGVNFLQMMGSVYPWFHGAQTLRDVLTGAAEGAVDGAVAAIIFGWLYNCFAGKQPQSSISGG